VDHAQEHDPLHDLSIIAVNSCSEMDGPIILGKTFVLSGKEYSCADSSKWIGKNAAGSRMIGK
jgi:hypothetical protein